MNKIKILFIDIVETLMRNISGTLGSKIRYVYYKKRLKFCGENVKIKENVYISEPQYISIDDNTTIDRNAIISAGKVDLSKFHTLKRVNKKFNLNEGELYIGKNVHIGPNCLIQAHGGVYFGSNGAMSTGAKLFSLSNSPTDPADPSNVIYFTNKSNNTAYHSSPITIDENVGVGINSIVLPGVDIGKNSYIAPNSIVVTRVKENSFMSGDPAVKIKNRFSNYDI
ncbi:MAG: hypothetical protein JXQ66_05625 [Campylobacterales bacterium]|nr:hypothetical protein [Campylobacterales bacterium]